MIATRLSSVVQVAGVAVAALLCYLVSQSVAAERGALLKVDRQIAAEQDAIGKLATEIATRSRLTQIENWNRQLALQAPRPSQYVDNGVQLASLFARDGHPQLPLDPAIAPPHGPIEQVSLPVAPVRALPSPAVAAPAPLPAPRAAMPPRALPALAPRGPIEEVAFHPAAPAKAHPTAPTAKPEPAPAPLLRNAAFVRPSGSRLDATAEPVARVALHADGTGLLSADIAGLAKAEQSKRRSSGEPK